MTHGEISPEKKQLVVLFVGARRNAIRVAKRLGMKILVICKNQIPPTIASLCDQCLQINFDLDSASFYQEVSKWLNGLVPDRVLALTEKGILHAASLREQMQIPGMKHAEALRIKNKFLMKQTVLSAGIPCAPFRRIDAETTFDSLAEHLRVPIIVKEVNSHLNSNFITVRTESDFKKHSYQDHMAEAYISGIEFSVESFIDGGKIVFRNVSEYFIPGWSQIVPFALSEANLNLIDDFNQNTLRAFGISHGMMHLEGFITPDRLVFKELAVRPPGNYLMDLIKHSYGFCPWTEYLKLEFGLAHDLENYQSQTPRPHGVLVLHPGAGHLKSIEGVLNAKQHPSMVRLRIHCKEGDFITPRHGASQSRAHAIVHGKDREDVITAMKEINRMIRFQHEV